MTMMKLISCYHVKRRKRCCGALINRPRARTRKQVGRANKKQARAPPIKCCIDNKLQEESTSGKIGQLNSLLKQTRRRRRSTPKRSGALQSACDSDTPRVGRGTTSNRRISSSNNNKWRPLPSFAQLFMCLILLCECQQQQLRQWHLFVGANSDANRLYEDLMMTYNRIVRPVQNESDRVVVHLGLKLSQLMEVNLKNQMMTINVWLNQEWSDYKLKWDPSEYGGIEEINLPAEQLWLPDIALYNSAEGYFAVSIMTKAKVRFDGYVTWNPPAIFRSSCQVDITYFPFDSQNCILKFGSWTFGTKLDLRHINATEGVIEQGTDLSEYYQNVEWDIMRATAKRNVIIYECCPNDIYPDVTFNFTIRRKPLFYTVNLILPCIGITFFSFLVFYLPSDSGEKVTLTISILVSLIFFLSVLIETIPPTSLAMPLLGKYLVFTMILITLSVCATVCVLNIHFRTPSTHSMPAWVKRWCMDILPKYLFMSVPQYQQASTLLPEQLIYAHNQAYASQAIALSGRVPSASIAELHNQVQQQTINNNARTSGDLNTKVCMTTQQEVASKFAADNKSTATPHKHHSSRAQSIAPLVELNATNLTTNACQQNLSTSFLPYLQSEAARRLQVQRSRSSERDTRSTSDTTNNQQVNGTYKKSDTSTTTKNVATSQQQQVRQSMVCKTTPPQRAPPVVPFWSNLFRGRRDSSGTTGAANVSNQENDRQNSEQQQRASRRRSRGSSTASSIVAYRTNDADGADDYEHHRHFQARASICSNNLWRIGPTRRCSLAVPINSYPTYYRPLAQLHTHTHAHQRRVPPASALPSLAGPHYHIHNNDSCQDESSSSSSSTTGTTANYAVGTLVNAAATNLLRPSQLLFSRPRVRHDELSSDDHQLEMDTLTSGGFIQFNAQTAHDNSALPPTRPFNSPISNSGPHMDMPTPPPPLAHALDMNESDAMTTSESAERSCGAQPPLPSAWQESRFSNQSQFVPACVSSQPSSSRIVCAGQNQFSYLLNANHDQLRHGQQVYQMPRSRSTTDHRLVSSSSLSCECGGGLSASVYAHTQPPIGNYLNEAQLQKCQHPATGVWQARDLCWRGSQMVGTGAPHPQPMPMPARLEQSHSSIGRQLGRAYIQRLQRQPATIYSLQSPVPSSAPRLMQSAQVCSAAPCRLGGGTMTHAIAMPEPSIDMMRRSRSQSSLNKRVATVSRMSAACEHACCFNDQLRPIGCAPPPPRPHSETRSRFNSMACQPHQARNSSSMRIHNSTQSGARNHIIIQNAFQSDQKQQAAHNSAMSHSVGGQTATRLTCNNHQLVKQANTLTMLKLVNEVDKAIQNAMFIAQHIDNLDEFESVKENWKYIAMVIDRIFLIIFLFACIVGTVAIFALAPWAHYFYDKPIDLQLTRLMALNFTLGDTYSSSTSQSCHEF